MRNFGEVWGSFMFVQYYRRWVRAQTLLILPVTVCLAGGAALSLGSDAARSFANLAGDHVIRLTGLFMLLGGAVTLYGMFRRDAFWETLGLPIGAIGTGIYGIGTLIGFGTGGIVSGIGYIGITLVLLERVVFTLTEVRARGVIMNGDRGDTE